MSVKHESISQQSLPLAPQEAHAAKIENFPSVVIDVFNAVIASKYSNGEARFSIGLIADKLEAAGLSKQTIYNIDFWCIDEIYATAGWKVEFKDEYVFTSNVKDE